MSPLFFSILSIVWGYLIYRYGYYLGVKDTYKKLSERDG
jgi:hypothetical protein